MRAGLLLLASGMVLWGQGCARPVAPTAKPPPELTLHRVTFTTFRGSERIAVGHAASLTYERTTGDATATIARLDRLPSSANASGRVIRIDADQVEGNVPDRVADAQGHVVFRDGKGLTGVTDRAHFDGPRSLATGDAPVTLHGPRFGADGVGFEARLDQDDLTLFGPVESRFGGKP